MLSVRHKFAEIFVWEIFISEAGEALKIIKTNIKSDYAEYFVSLLQPPSGPLSNKTKHLRDGLSTPHPPPPVPPGQGGLSSWRTSCWSWRAASRDSEPRPGFVTRAEEEIFQLNRLDWWEHQPGISGAGEFAGGQRADCGADHRQPRPEPGALPR